MYMTTIFKQHLYSIDSNLYENCSGSVTSAGEGRANLSAIVYLSVSMWFSVRRGFLFLWVFGMGCVILLWHSLGLPYNYVSYGASLGTGKES